MARPANGGFLRPFRLPSRASRERRFASPPRKQGPGALAISGLLIRRSLVRAQPGEPLFSGVWPLRARVGCADNSRLPRLLAPRCGREAATQTARAGSSGAPGEASAKLVRAQPGEPLFLGALPLRARVGCANNSSLPRLLAPRCGREAATQTARARSSRAPSEASAKLLRAVRGQRLPLGESHPPF